MRRLAIFALFAFVTVAHARTVTCEMLTKPLALNATLPCVDGNSRPIWYAVYTSTGRMEAWRSLGPRKKQPIAFVQEVIPSRNVFYYRERQRFVVWVWEDANGLRWMRAEGSK